MTTSPISEPKWKFIERIIAVLEQMLAPGALVEHDRQVPEIATGFLRQCDVVVRYGMPPRQTLAAIVEVQDRNSKVDLPIFEGWCRKREKVGAQRLICVSREGYTQEVEKEASVLGEVVSLMTLCEPDQPPIFIASTPVHFHGEIIHHRDATVVFEHETPGVIGSCDDKIFERPSSSEKLDLYSLAENSLRDGTAKDVRRRKVGADRFELTFRVEFGAGGEPLLLRTNATAYSVQEVRFCDLIEEVQQVLTSVPLAYEQRNINGALGWVLFGKGTYQGQEFYTQQPFLKLPDGTAQPGPPSISKITGCTALSSVTEFILE